MPQCKQINLDKKPHARLTSRRNISIIEPYQQR